MKKQKGFPVRARVIFSKLASDSAPFEWSHVCAGGGVHLVVAPPCVTGAGRGNLSLA